VAGPGFEVLKKLSIEARPLTAVLREYLQMHEHYDLYCDCAQKLRFERMAYERFGGSNRDFADYTQRVMPLLAQTSAIERHATAMLRRQLEAMEQLAFGIRRPLREPICHTPVLPSTWPVLTISFAGDEAKGDGIGFTAVTVASTTNLAADDRAALKRLLSLEEARQTKLAEERGRSHLGSVASAIEKLSKSIANQQISLSAPSAPVDVRLVDIDSGLLARAIADAAEKPGPPEAAPPDATVNGQAAAEEASKRRPGRPTRKDDVYRVQLERWAAGTTADSCAEEARQIEKMLKARVKGGTQHGGASVPKQLSIENLIRRRYRRLQGVNNAINYLRGARPK
jgi:hypothetical protein